MKKTLIRLAALVLVLVLCIGMMPAAYATEPQPQQTEEPAEPEENSIDWSFWLTAVMLGLACILHTRNQKRRRERNY